MTTAAEELEARREAEITATAAKDAFVAGLLEATAPLFNRVLVKMRRQDITAGGLHLADRDKVSATLAYVIKRGPDCKAANIAEGGLVVLMRHMGVDLDFPGFQTKEKYKLVREDEIAGALDGEAVERYLRGDKAEPKS